VKFKDIDPGQWEELKPYLDTCLLPLTGLTGNESPGRATDELVLLQKWMDVVEVPFTGRMVTYPALHYTPASDASKFVNELCSSLREEGFRYIVLITASGRFKEESFEADLLLSQAVMNAAEAVRLVQELWHGGSSQTNT
jgi:23S rRNA (pseudouridine1915-N3)-methyltransferase